MLQKVHKVVILFAIAGHLWWVVGAVLDSFWELKFLGKYHQPDLPLKQFYNSQRWLKMQMRWCEIIRKAFL